MSSSKRVLVDGIGRDSIEGVSGGIEPGETARGTAERELEEELGLRAERWTELGTVDPFTTIVVSPTRLYLAEGLTQGPTRPSRSPWASTISGSSSTSRTPLRFRRHPGSPPRDSASPG